MSSPPWPSILIASAVLFFIVGDDVAFVTQ
jgi:hypothetical protein